MPVVTFDFDGVLQLRSPFVSLDAMEPRPDIHDAVRREAETNSIAIVTGRSDRSVADLRRFVDLHNLPISDIVTTNGDSKVPALERLGAIRHYDDDKDVRDELADTSVEFVLVTPFARRTT